MPPTIAAVWRDQNQQALFRRLLEAMSYPGSRVDCRDLIGEEHAAVGLLASLLDSAVSVADPQGLLDEERLRFLEAPQATAAEADFILLDGSAAPPTDWQPRIGPLTAPERSATLVLQVAGLGQGPVRMRWTGPGIDGACAVSVDGLHTEWIEQRRRWCAAFPMGINCYLADPVSVIALPRTTRIHMEEN